MWIKPKIHICYSCPTSVPNLNIDIVTSFMTYPMTAVDKMNSEGPRTGQCWWYGVGVLAPAAHSSHHLTGFHVSAGRCWCRCTYFWFNEHYKWECQNKNLTIALAMSSKKLLYKRGRPVPKICRLVQELYRVIHWSTVYWKFGDDYIKSGHLFSWI